jgi:AcrR family transcriptional regulator
MNGAAARTATAASTNDDAAPRSRKGARTRARLIAAAREVFERDGFLTARISDIAASAGLSQGSFYHYFDSKEQIFREVAEAQEQQLIAAPVEPSDDDSELSVHETIRRDNRLYLERYRDAARLMGVIEQVSRYDEHVNAARMATQQHFADKAERTIRRLQRQGLVDKRLSPRIAADALGAMMSRFAELQFVQHFRAYDFDDVAEQLTLLCLNALGVPDAPETSRGRRRPSSTG